MPNSPETRNFSQPKKTNWSKTMEMGGLVQRGLVVGNYCHDVLIRDNVVIAESLGGAASFISAVFSNLLSLNCYYVSKVGSDFSYSSSLSTPPIVSLSSETTLFHAHFFSESPKAGVELNSSPKSDRVLKRVRACDLIYPRDLPEFEKFEFGMVVGVGGEILPETLERLIDVCDVVFVDIQGLIREFDEVDGTVRLVSVKESGFYHLLPRIGFLKASADEAKYIDLEEMRKWCCVLVTNGEYGCKVYWNGGEMQVSPFPTSQIDPTGAGDSFLAGFVAGLVEGLAVPDAALLGNFFGSLTVAQLGLPKFDFDMQRVKDEVNRRKTQYPSCLEKKDHHKLIFNKPLGHDVFHASLSALKEALLPPPLTQNHS